MEALNKDLDALQGEVVELTNALDAANALIRKLKISNATVRKPKAKKRLHSADGQTQTGYHSFCIGREYEVPLGQWYCQECARPDTFDPNFPEKGWATTDQR